MRFHITATIAVALAVSAQGANPVVQTCFTTDPAPMVSGDRLYLYTGHDENGADFFWMQEWRVYSTGDMANWTDHGSPLAIEDFAWADDRAWAPQCVERGGKYYLYVPVHSRLSGGMAIGVAVANYPTGPFKDALGKPLFDNGSWDNIDPTVLVDGERAFIAWGNPNIYFAELGDDMISLKSAVQTIEQTEEGFGAPGPDKRVKGKKYADNYTEGPWLDRRGDLYYLLYAAGGVPEHLAYSTAPSVQGPWTYRGEIMPLCDTRSFTNHPGMAHFKGHDYFFYHTGRLPRGGGFGRSVAVEEFDFNADGSFPTILPTDQGVKQVGHFNPYGRIEAETMAWSQGVTTEPNAATGVYLSDIHNGDYTMLRGVNFGSGGPAKVGAAVASALRGGTVEVRMDSITGPLVAELKVPPTGGWENWQYVETPALTEVPGVHDIYFVFRGRKGPKLMNVDYWMFK